MGKPFFLFREDFAVLSSDPFKILILTSQSEVLLRSTGAYLHPQIVAMHSDLEFQTFLPI